MKRKRFYPLILKLLNPVNFFRAISYASKKRASSRAELDPQLKFYSQILKSGMLHYGYFDDVDIKFEEMSIKDIEDAQVTYAKNIISLISNKNENVLDVGAGMGGLGNMLLKNGFSVTCLTPDKHQASFIRDNYPSIKVIESKYEQLSAVAVKYSTIINSESLQYIPLDEAFKKTKTLLQDGGEWIVCDYFRKKEFAKTKSKSGHIYEDFIEKAAEHGWKIVENRDITENILPTLYYIYSFANRFLRPLIGLVDSKFGTKLPKIYYYFSDMLSGAEIKFDKEMAVVNPEKFTKEKKYVLLRLVRV